MLKNQTRQEKILKILAALLLGLTIFFSLSAPTANSIYLFLLLFILFWWQSCFLQKFLERLAKSISPLFTYLLIAVLWAAILELTLAQFAFHPKPLISFLLSLGFYLPYFIIWRKLISKFHFNFLEIFYLAGLSGVLFGLIITKQILIPFTLHPDPKIALVALAARVIATLVIFGCLTSLPLLLLFKKDKLVERSFKQYLLAIISTILALPFFLIWSRLVGFLV